MEKVTVNIQVCEKQDLQTIIDWVKAMKVESPLYVINAGDYYELRFESDGFMNIHLELASLFQEYEYVDSLKTGRSDIRIIVQQSSINYSMEPVSELSYLLFSTEKHTEVKQGRTKFSVWFGELEKEYQVNIVPGHNTVTGEKGFLIVGDIAAEREKRPILLNQLFEDKKKAFWRGLAIMEPHIEKDYAEYRLHSKKVKRKNPKDPEK